jgi:hypothetical protein
MSENEKFGGVDLDVIKMHAQLPELLAKLSYHDVPKTLEYIRYWGEKSKTINFMYEGVSDALLKYEPNENGE